MTDRENLIALMEEAYYCSIEELSDHLLANGVVVREKGEWGRFGLTKHKTVCKNCKSGTPFHKNKYGYFVLWESNFCPHCGSDMRKGENG